MFNHPRITERCVATNSDVHCSAAAGLTVSRQ
jgi:hypothetical protein